VNGFTCVCESVSLVCVKAFHLCVCEVFTIVCEWFHLCVCVSISVEQEGVSLEPEGG